MRSSTTSSSSARRARKRRNCCSPDPRRIYFTTPHWNGYPAVPIHIPDPKQLSRAEVRDAVVEAWLTRAPKRVATARLAEN